MTALGIVQWLAIGVLLVALLHASLTAKGYEVASPVLFAVWAVVFAAGWPATVLMLWWMSSADPNGCCGCCDCDLGDDG